MGRGSMSVGRAKAVVRNAGRRKASGRSKSWPSVQAKQAKDLARAKKKLGQ